MTQKTNPRPKPRLSLLAQVADDMLSDAGSPETVDSCMDPKTLDRVARRSACFVLAAGGLDPMKTERLDRAGVVAWLDHLDIPHREYFNPTPPTSIVVGDVAQCLWLDALEAEAELAQENLKAQADHKTAGDQE